MSRLLRTEWVAWFKIWWHCLWRILDEQPHQMCAAYAHPKPTVHFCSCGYGNGGVTWNEFMRSREHLQYEAAGSKAIRVNGRDKRVLHGFVSYDDVVWLAGLSRGRHYTMTYWTPKGGPRGTLSSGESIRLYDGMTFAVADTSGA